MAAGAPFLAARLASTRDLNTALMCDKSIHLGGILSELWALRHNSAV